MLGLREAVGDDPAEWYPALTGRAWPGGKSESELLASAKGVVVASSKLSQASTSATACRAAHRTRSARRA